MALIAGSSLSGCSVDLLSKVGLEKKQTPVELTQTVTPQDPDQSAPGRQSGRNAIYVDPMVAKAGSQKRAEAGQMAANHKPDTQTQKASPALAHTSASATPANDLGQVVTQPTAVTASANSIYSLANAQVAAAEGIAAYAPVRNINPMSGSVFSARLPAEPTAEAPSQTQPAAGGNGDGLW
ncbi:hypothetical protein ACFSE1_06220 [Rhizobium helianthi]|uniref:Lipoprotein n=1 Tax=Rhizobium helianthi TaxID=1132695 RepID=A0ABW4M0U3_9HYPH